MAQPTLGGRVDLEDVTAAAIAGVARARASIGVRPGKPFDFPIWVGFIFNPDWPENPLDPREPEQPGIFRLTAQDHTLIVEEVLGNALPLLRALGATQGRRSDFPADEVLAALARVTNSDEVRDAVGRTLQVRKTMADAQIDRVSQSKIKKLMGRVRDAKGVDAKIKILQSELGAAAGDDGYKGGIAGAIEILEAGRSTIYNPDYIGVVFGADEGSGTLAKDAGEEIADADIEGAVSGGVAGAIVGAVSGGSTIAVGAFAGGVGNSAGKAVMKLIDWLF